MRIANNIMAMNAHRQLTINQNYAMKAMERLSSGFRINRAGDDAAGLAISEKMRGQVRGLKMAQKNAQDAISLIQTAEGALQESHAILQRMRELAVQAASDTNTDADRNEIQKEIDQLARELTRIAETTEFNTKKLLDGSFTGTFHIGANEGQNITLNIANMSGEALKVGLAYEATNTSDTSVGAVNAGEVYTVVQFEARDIGLSAGTQVADAKYGWADSDGKIVAVSADGKTYYALSSATDIEKLDTTTDVLNETFAFSAEVTHGTVTTEAYDDTGDGTDDSLRATASFGIDVWTQQKADQAITVINRAIESVSAERSKLGAYQNRLEHTIANLGVSAENLQAAESRIRDVDMAAEMMTFTKYQILQQASTAMLAQANLLPQSVLQLLG